MPVYLNRCFTTCLQADSTVAPPLASLHFQVRFGMERRARPPPIRLHLLPAVWTGCLRLPAISMLQQKLPWQLTFQLLPKRRRLACYLNRGRLRMPFPPTPTSRQTSPRPRAQILPSALSVSLRGSFAILIPFSLSTQRFGMHPTTGGITQTYVPELLQEAWPLAFHRHLESLVVTEYSGGCPARGPHNSSRRVNKTARNCRYTRGRSQERVLSDAVENETAC